MSETEEVVDVVEQRDFEQEARDQGWKPQEEFQGDPDKWVDAETFVSRGEQYVGILKDRYDKLEQRLRYQEQLTEDVKNLHKRQTEADKVRIAELVTQLEARQEKAISEGDGAAFKEASKQLKQAEEAKRQLEQPKQQPVQPWATDWMQKNDWYGKHEDATAVAEAHAKRLRESGTAMSEPEFLNKVSEYVKGRFPELAGAQARRNPVVEGEGRPPSGGDQGPRGSQYNKLPDEAKGQFTKFVKLGIYENTAEARAEYAKLYLN